METITARTLRVLRTHLEPLRAQIVSAKARLEALNEQVEALVTEAKLPKGWAG